MDFAKTLLLIASLSSLLFFNANAARLLEASVPPPSPSAAPAPASKDSVLGAADPRLAELCKGGENPDLCVETISPYINGPVDLARALEIQIEATKNESEKLSGILAAMVNDEGNNKELMGVLKVCAENYESVMDNIEESVKALKENDMGTFGIMMSSVISDQQACEDAFKETPMVEMPFPDDSLAIFQLAANSLATFQFLISH